ncbi:MAG: hypothetical protein ACW98K_18795 [Candidatus Kariarchaeaceae archaeon]
MSISSIAPEELTEMYVKIIEVSSLEGERYVYSGDNAAIKDALLKLLQFGFGDGNSVPNYQENYPWKDW